MCEGRIERGRAIANASNQLREAPDGTWIVLSQSRISVRYAVNVEKRTCTCPDYATWEMDCKHIYAVAFFRSNDHEEPQVQRQSYPQPWAAYNAAQIHEEQEFGVLLKALCEHVQSPPQTRGRPRLALADMIFACTLKVYTTFSGRRASTAVREYEQKQLLGAAPHHNSISNYLRKPELTPLLKRLVEESATPLKAVESQFAADATGFSTCTYESWFDHRYGQSTGRKARWLKAHAMVGTITNVVTAIEITEGHVADATQLPDLVSTTAKRFDNIAEVSADKAYLGNLNLLAIESVNAVPFIPFKSNSQGAGAGTTDAWKRMWHAFWFKRDEFLGHYHRRSNVESTFSMIKRKFGGSLRSKHFRAQVNELLCKILAHNLVVLVHEMHELGIDPTFAKPNAATVNALPV